MIPTQGLPVVSPIGKSSTVQLPVSSGSSPESSFEERLRMFEVIDAIIFSSPERLLAFNSNSIGTKGSPFSKLSSKFVVVELEDLKGVQKIKSRLFSR